MILESKSDQDDLVKWLHSFPPEYASQISHLVEQIRKIQLRKRPPTPLRLPPPWNPPRIPSP
ncbi:nwd2 [Moniliophthora roreri]|nr:nwd2 [Moniliophthora roreri]